jgi:hypothetical protein
VVAGRRVLVVPLQRSEWDMVIVFRRKLAPGGPCVQTALTTVEAHASHVDVVDHCLVVDVGDVNASEVGNRPVVVKRIVAPVTALETNSAIAVPVVDSAVEADVRAPVTLMPRVYAATPAPVAGRPQQAGGGRQNPCAGHPVVIVIAVSPVPRRPDITNCGARWLYVHRECRWRYVDGDSDRDERERRHRQRRQREAGQSSPGRSEAKRFLTHDDLVAIGTLNDG